MDPAQLASLLFSDEDDAPSRAAAYAKALRGQQQLGQLGLLTGDKVLGNLGQSLLQGAGRGEGHMADVGQRRQGALLQRALATQQQSAQMERDKFGAGADMEKLKAQQGGQMDLAKYGAGQEWRRLMAELGARKDKAGKDAASNAAKQAFDNTESLRKELLGNQATKQFQDVDSAYGKVENIAKATPSAAGDIGLIFSFMKIVDPGSSVKEGEAATAQNATNVPGKVVNLYNQVMSGQRLSREQRQDFLSQSNNLYQAHAEQYEKLKGQYRGYAQKQGLNPDDVSLGLSVRQLAPQRAGVPQGLNLDAPGGAPGPGPADDAAAVEWAKANQNDPDAQAILRMHGLVK